MIAIKYCSNKRAQLQILARILDLYTFNNLKIKREYKSACQIALIRKLVHARISNVNAERSKFDNLFS